MEAKELRIGNLVIYYGRIVSITGITEEHPFINMITADYSEWKEIEPIPLTEEWLLKSGYFKLDNNGSVHFVVKGHTIWICNNMYLCEKNGIILKYVHQLQNLYLALTNKELTIVY